MTRLWLVGLVGVLAGCVDSSTHRCGELVCSETAVCSPTGDRCVAQSQLDACNAAADGTGCSYPGVPEGVCNAGVCLGAGCGNGIVDPNSEEQCDDGNRISLDGCSADCASDERCGDGVADLAVGELCDCGDGSKSVPGCAMANADVSGASCRTNCLPSRCGDTVLDPLEECDDGNTLPGDGCRADCMGRWTPMASGTYADLFDVWGSGPNDVWAVGFRKLLHFDGTAWTAMPLPLTPLPEATYYQVWGTGPNDVWALGGTRIDHYNGISWTENETIIDTTDQRRGRSLWGSGPNELWVGLEEPGIGGLKHNAAGAWTFYDFYSVVEMSGTSATNVLAIIDSGQNNDRNRLMRWDGNAWNAFTADGSVSAEPVTAIVAQHVHPLAENDIFAYDGYSGAGPTMRHYNGSAWTATPCCDEMVGAEDFGGVPGDFVMVGYQGRITTSQDGYTWKIAPSGTTANLHAVWSYAPNRAFVVGDGGTILY